MEFALRKPRIRSSVESLICEGGYRVFLSHLVGLNEFLRKVYTDLEGSMGRTNGSRGSILNSRRDAIRPGSL